MKKYSHANGFMTNSEFTYKLTKYQCEQAKSKKSMTVQFGTQIVLLTPKGAITKTQMFMHNSVLHQNQTCVGAVGKVYLGPDKPNFEQKGNLIVELVTTLRVLEEKALLSTDITPIKIIIPRMGIEDILTKGTYFKQTETGTLTADFTDLIPRTEIQKCQI